MKLKPLVVALTFVLLCGASGYAQSDREVHAMAVRAVRTGNNDSAFMYFRSLLETYADSKYTEEALFATAEYYFTKQDYRDAYHSFMKFIDTYPDSKAYLFALSYVFNIAEKLGKDSLLENVKRELVNRKQQVFLFKASKEAKYRSPFLRMHKVIYYIDKIEFYVDDTLLEKISF